VAAPRILRGRPGLYPAGLSSGRRGFGLCILVFFRYKRHKNHKEIIVFCAFCGDYSFSIRRRRRVYANSIIQSASAGNISNIQTAGVKYHGMTT
jgi:hypothetical protein